MIVGKINKRILSIALASAMTLLLNGGAWAQMTGLTSRGQHNRIILSAASIFEDMSDAALSADKAGLQRALQSYDGQSGKVEKILPLEKRRVLKASVAEIGKAVSQRDYVAVALEAPEVYRTLIESLDRKVLKVPAEVSLMDYAGFKLRALLNAKSGDWKQMRDVASEAEKNWSAIKSSVKNKSLRDAVETAVEGIKSSSVSKNSEMALFAAKINLALIDLLETYFDKKKLR
jgi:hypothetical protein